MDSPSPYKTLISSLALHRSLAVAFSGGVDSALLSLAAQHALPGKAVALTAVSPFLPKRELEEARKTARRIGIRHIEVPVELSSRKILENPPDRCYHCKKELFRQLLETCSRLGLDQLIDGSNKDDKTEERPGMRALRELKISSPLREEGMGKSLIRKSAREQGLSCWDLPSRACLASRIPAGLPITMEKLSQVEEGEERLTQLGYTKFRLRHHGELARIEYDPKELQAILDPMERHKIVKAIRPLGFRYVCIDLEAYRPSGLTR